MAVPNNIVVTEMPGAMVSPDGSFAEMRLKNSDGTTQTLRFSPSTMMTFVNRIFELFLNEKIKKEQALGYGEVQPLSAVTTFAQEAVGGKALILGFRLETGLPVAFSVPPSEAEELHKQLGEAVEKAKRQFSESRH